MLILMNTSTWIPSERQCVVGFIFAFTGWEPFYLNYDTK